MKAKRDDTEPVLGLRAGLAVFARRREDVVRVVFAREVRTELGEVARWGAAHRVPVEEARVADIDRIAGSTHHEGLVVVARPRRWTSSSELAVLLTQGGGAALALDRVRNPYNVGAVVRSAAFFGCAGVVLGAPSPDPGLPPTAVRVAEGGAEEIRLVRTTDLADTLARLRSAGVHVAGTDARAQTQVSKYAFPRPTVVVLGNEREGLSDRVRAQCDKLVAIRGTGRMDSLNVAVAAGVLLAAMTSSPA